MANRADFKETNPFAKMPSIQIKSTSTKPPYVRRSSIARAAPKAPSTPPKLPNGTSNEKQLRQQLNVTKKMQMKKEKANKRIENRKQKEVEELLAGFQGNQGEPKPKKRKLNRF
eukprot:161281_1